MVRRCLRVFLGIVFAAWVTFLGGLFVLLFAHMVTPNRSWGAVPDYSQAESKAQEAFLVQSGIQKQLNDGGTALHGMATRCVPASVFDSTFALGAVARTKRLATKEFSSPVIPYAKHTVTLTTTQGTIVTLWHF